MHRLATLDQRRIPSIQRVSTAGIVNVNIFLYDRTDIIKKTHTICTTFLFLFLLFTNYPPTQTFPRARTSKRSFKSQLQAVRIAFCEEKADHPEAWISKRRIAILILVEIKFKQKWWKNVNTHWTWRNLIILQLLNLNKEKYYFNKLNKQAAFCGDYF